MGTVEINGTRSRLNKETRVLEGSRDVHARQRRAASQPRLGGLGALGGAA